MKPAVAIHVYRDDATKDHTGAGRCAECSLPKGNRVHELPDTSEASNFDLRRLGERATEEESAAWRGAAACGSARPGSALRGEAGSTNEERPSREVRATAKEILS